MKGILGRKLGMTQVFTNDGALVAVSVVEATPNIVLQKKTMENDGYEAIQLGFEDKRSNLSNKAEQGHVSKAATAPKRFIKEIRGSEMMGYEVGAAIDVNIFAAGEVIDVQGVSKGKGFQGAIKRHNFSIGPKAHGSGYHRGIGSMGPVDPARIFKGKKMAGQMGNETVTIQNLEIVAIDTEKHLILVKGSIPGPKRGLVLVKSSIKHPGQVNQAATLVDLTPVKNEEVADEVVAEATAE